MVKMHLKKYLNITPSKKYLNIAPSKNVFQNFHKLNVENKSTRCISYSNFKK